MITEQATRIIVLQLTDELLAPQSTRRGVRTSTAEVPSLCS
jgi:hypothetical protein